MHLLMEHKMRTKVSLTIEKDVAEAARDMKLNMSRLAEEAIAKAVKAERGRIWSEENRAALESSDAYVEKHGLPLEKYRTF